VWVDDLESNTHSFVLVCVSILCICKLEDGVKLSTRLHVYLTTDRVPDLISEWHLAQSSVIFVMEFTV